MVWTNPKGLSALQYLIKLDRCIQPMTTPSHSIEVGVRLSVQLPAKWIGWSFAYLSSKYKLGIWVKSGYEMRIYKITFDWTTTNVNTTDEFQVLSPNIRWTNPWWDEIVQRWKRIFWLRKPSGFGNTQKKMSVSICISFRLLKVHRVK